MALVLCASFCEFQIKLRNDNYILRKMRYVLTLKLDNAEHLYY